MSVRQRVWTKYTIAERLQRDAKMTAAFLAAHGMRPEPSRKGAELQAAEDYFRWCATEGINELDALDGGAVGPFIDQWRMRAVMADVRSAALGVEVRAVAVCLCVFTAVLAGITHNLALLAIAGVLSSVLMASLWLRRSELIIGPDGPGQLPPLVSGESPFGGRGQDLAFRLADSRRI